jgi:tRNA threonylcarbamoyladenosine biosynthesis protein TsaE
VTASHRSAGPDDTEAAGASLARTLTAGAVVLLVGDLGVGKTVFVRGVAAGLGIPADEVTSPTFTLVHEYAGGRLPLQHLDLYRLDRADLDEIGLDPDVAALGVTLVEWADRLARPVAGAIVVRIRDLGDDSREIAVEHPAR